MEKSRLVLIILERYSPKRFRLPQVLVAQLVDNRASVFERSIGMASQYGKSAHMLLLNMKLAHAELDVHPQQRSEEK
jgi:hypothetical protein